MVSQIKLSEKKNSRAQLMFCFENQFLLEIQM